MDDKELFAALIQLAQQSNDSGLQARLAQISQMAPDEQAAAIADLSRDYEGKMQTSRDTQTLGYKMANAAAPEGRQGPSGNPYSVYMAANPLEHLASGLRQFKGGQMMNEAQSQLGELSAGQERATSGVMNAGLQGAQANMLRGSQKQKPLYMTDEEWRRLQMRGA